MAKYAISEMSVKMAPEDILRNYEETIKPNDFFGEYTVPCTLNLPFALVRTYLNEDVSAEQWAEAVAESNGNKSAGDKLREDLAHYRDWWRSKIEGERGISVERGKAQFAIRMMLADLPEWRTLWDMDGGWYQRDAYNYVAGLFGFDEV